MPTQAQDQLLDSFIDQDGIYLSTILENLAFDLGTKILYLERAISYNCHEFLQSLDKLYDPSLQGEEKDANIEFIRALKTINNLCFNNEVRYGGYGARGALTHYFGSLGEVNPEHFRDAIQASIQERINILQEHHEQEITEQKKLREEAEEHIVGQITWRVELDLPEDQLVLTITQLLNVTAEQFQELPEDLRLLIADYPTNTSRLIEECGATFAIFQGLTTGELRELLQDVGYVSHLVNTVNLPLANLLIIEQELRTRLIDNSHQVDVLVNNLHLPLNTLLELAPDLQTELIEKGFYVAHLVRTLHLPLENLLALERNVRSELIENAFRLEDLFTDVNVLFEKLPELSVEQLRTVLNDPQSEAAQDILNPVVSGLRLGCRMS